MINTYGQSDIEGLYFSLSIDGFRVNNDSVSLFILSKKEAIPIRIEKNRIYVPYIKNKKTKLYTCYQSKCYRFKNVFHSPLYDRLDFYVDNVPFSQASILRLNRKPRKSDYIMYYTLTANLSDEQINENSSNGVMYPILISKIYCGKN